MAIEAAVMDIKTALTIFSVVFVAELGDKTQLATLLFAADKNVGKLTVFLSASAALVLAVLVAVVAGGVLSHYLDEKLLRYIAGTGFVLIGIWTLWSA